MTLLFTCIMILGFSRRPNSDNSIASRQMQAVDGYHLADTNFQALISQFES